MWKTLKIPFFLALLAIGLIGLPPLAPVRSGGRQLIIEVVRPFAAVKQKYLDYLSIIVTLGSIIEENQAFHDRNTELQSQIIALQEVVKENNLLREQLKLPDRDGIKFVIASVAAANPNQFLQSLTIDKGTHHGIKSGFPALSKGFLIGVIDRVDSKTSSIQLITSHQLRLAVTLQDSRTIGLLSGGLQGVTIEDIPIDIQVKQGEAIVSAGQQGAIRSGIPIGTVEQIISSRSDIYQTALVKLPVSLRSLDQVFIELYE